MRRFVSIPLLAIGTVLGYGFAFHSMHHHHCSHDAWERHMSDRGDRRDTVRGDKPRTDNPPPSTGSTEP